MIKPEDLRIGDFVRVSQDCMFPKGTMCVVSDINPLKVFNDKKGVVSLSAINDDDDGPWGAWCCNVEGILITSEILKKNGFKEEQHQKDGTSEWYDYYHYDLGINIVYEVEENKFAAYLDGKKLREIQYAHELQHILWALGLNAELKV
jgi:hypothetical protein